MALFITFEGVEGSGKSYQAQALYRKLASNDIPALLTHEPGGTPPGERITKLLKWGQDMEISPLTELMLFNASRAQLMEEVVRPALAEGKTVICDRHTDSTLAYQSFGKGLDAEIVSAVNTTATGGLKPDLTVLLDVPVDIAFARKAGDKYDRFEAEDADFHRRVREGYVKLAEAEPERWLVLDGTLSREQVKKEVWQKVRDLL